MIRQVAEDSETGCMLFSWTATLQFGEILCLNFHAGRPLLGSVLTAVLCRLPTGHTSVWYGMAGLQLEPTQEAAVFCEVLQDTESAPSFSVCLWAPEKGRCWIITQPGSPCTCQASGCSQVRAQCWVVRLSGVH